MQTCCHHCDYCNVGFVLVHSVTCYTDSLLSYIHVNTAHLNITCILVATSVVLGSLGPLHTTRLRAHDRHTSSIVIGGEGGANPSLVHSTLEGPMEYVNAIWM